MGKQKPDKAMAAQIAAWRDEGLTDAQIIARHGSDNLSNGYKWIDANPGVDPRGEKAGAKPAPSRGSGPAFQPARLASR